MSHSGQMLQVASPASLHFLGLSPKALGSGLQPFKALTFATETASTIIDQFKAESFPLALRSNNTQKIETASDHGWMDDPFQPLKRMDQMDLKASKISLGAVPVDT